MAISTHSGVSAGLVLNDCNKVESSPASCQTKLFSLFTLLIWLHFISYKLELKLLQSSQSNFIYLLSLSKEECQLSTRNCTCL